jgi:DNA-binding protein YbaB
MRNVLLTTTCLTLLLAGCSKSEPQAPVESRGYVANNAVNPNAPMADVAPEAAGGSPSMPAIIPPTNTAPGVNVTAAPGVAFNYAYAFRLPAQNIKDAQEAHAQACEKLGVQRCRITGMVYRVTGENSIEGSIQFKLDPTLARAFGKAGIDAVTKADGKLVEAEITGTDAGAAIKSLDAQRQQAQTELQRIDRELARGDLKTEERSELQRQRAALTGQLQQVKSDTSDQEESLANTPVSFSYQSGVAVRGFDGSAPITSAGNVFLDSAQITLGFVLTLLAAITPPGLIVLIIFLLWRRFRPRRPVVTPEA